MTQEISISPLHDTSIEKAVIGIILQEKFALRLAMSLIRHPDLFHDTRHEIIYKTAVEMDAESHPVDILTITQKLISKGQLKEVGGPVYIAECTSLISAADNLESHIRILTELWMKRILHKISAKNHQLCNDPTTDAFDILTKMQGEIIKITDALSVKSARMGKEIYRDCMSKIGEAMLKPAGVTGVPSGLDELDEITGGWQDSDLIIIGGRPGMGKTTFALQCFRNAVVDYGKNALFFSLEMSSDQLVTKMIASESGYSTSKLSKGRISEDEFKKVQAFSQSIYRDEFMIDDTPGITINQLRSKAVTYKMKYGLDFIIIDYLQLINTDTKGMNREQQVSLVSRNLKVLAKELNVPVMALAQLGRGTEVTGDKRPSLKDLRESGAIEQDADMVLFPFRPEYYNIREYEDGAPTENTAEIIIEKHRNGALGAPIVGCNMKLSKFYNLGKDNLSSFQNTAF